MTTYAEYIAEYDAAASYDVDNSTSLAARFIVAVRGMLRFASMSRREGLSMEHDPSILQDQLNQALAWLEANQTVSESSRTANPDVSHADFSGFGQYGGDYR